MNLFLLRHGVAVEREEFDFARDDLRPLTVQGKKQLRQVAAAMRVLELNCEVILSSPLVRARQTAEIMAADLKLKRHLAFADELKPGGDFNGLIRRMVQLKPAVENILLVGHEPDLNELISLLVTGNRGAGLALKKGGLAKLELEKLRAGKCATLRWLLTPALLKRMR